MGAGLSQRKSTHVTFTPASHVRVRPRRRRSRARDPLMLALFLLLLVIVVWGATHLSLWPRSHALVPRGPLAPAQATGATVTGAATSGPMEASQDRKSTRLNSSH